jgi:hypothetical protein
MTRWRAGLGLLTLVLAVSGCGRTVSPGAAGQASTFPVRPGPLTTQTGLPAPGAAGRFPAEPGPPVWVDAACPPEVSDADPLSQANRGRLPDEFVTAWVLRCRTEIRYVPGQGKQAFRVTERADTPAAELVSQLRLPAEPPTAGGCLAYGVSVPYFALVDAGGRALLPAVPLDECLRPRREALQELDKLPFTRLSETPAGQVQSQESIDTGCPEAYQDMIIISADRAKPAPARPLWPGSPAPVRVCFYDPMPGKDVPGGRLRTARTIDAGVATELVAALDKAGPAAACSVPHNRFALVAPASPDSWAMAELDGCHRLLRPDGTLGQLDDRVVGLLG